MPDETAVIEADEVENPSDRDVEGFTWEDYRHYFPDEGAEFLIKLFQEKRYGWKTRARLLQKIDVAQKYLDRLMVELADSCTSERQPRKSSTRTINPRDGLRAYLTSLTDEDLKILAQEKNVSYNSFMSSGDRVGLVETIVDEMMPS